MVSIAQAFRHDDRVALFVFAMCMASNDVENALAHVDDASALHGYFVRLAVAHTIEGLSAYDIWLKDPEVKAFIRTVDRKWSRARKTTAALRHEVGSALGTARNHTFHYPAPGRYDADVALSSVVAAMGDDAAELRLISRGPGKPKRVRFQFADVAATMLALRELTTADTSKLRRELAAAREGCSAFVTLVGWLFEAYTRRADLDSGDPQWESEKD